MRDYSDDDIQSLARAFVRLGFHHLTAQAMAEEVAHPKYVAPPKVTFDREYGTIGRCRHRVNRAFDPCAVCDAE